jgi:hypothetical protein
LHEAAAKRLPKWRVRPMEVDQPIMSQTRL